MKGIVSFIVLLFINILSCLSSSAQINFLGIKSKGQPASAVKEVISNETLLNNTSVRTNNSTAFCDALGIYNKDTTICLGATFTLHAKSALDYKWSPGNGLSSTTVQEPALTADATRTYTLISRAYSGNLVTNGDFSSGDVSINSSYGYRDCTDGLCLIPEGLYGIRTEAHKLHNQFVGSKDHTTGSGNFMIVNGAGSPNTVVWSQTITIKQNTDYNFSTWVSSLLPGSPAILQFQINGVTIGPPFNAPASVDAWERFFVLWNSGNNTTATITILNQNTTANGNDFGLDDIFFQELTPCPATITVTVLKKPTIEIKASPTAICEGTPITFTATAKDEGPTAVYQWKLNGTNVGTNTNTFTSGTLKDGDEITSTVTNSCGTTESNKIKITVATKLSPAITIKASATDICIGTPVTFTAALTNEGSAPLIQWKKNGQPVGVSNSTYIDNNLADGDIISASLTSNAGCLITPLAESNVIPIKVSVKRTPTIAITSSGTSICAGTPVSFTATATVTGSAPVYQWKKNGTTVGSNATTYTDNALVDGDVITAVLTSNETCVTSTTAASKEIKITVVSNLAPSITIKVSTTTICPGTPVTFTATANGGSAPVYQWKKNGNPVGTNAPTYTDSDLKNNDEISCTLIANDPCVLAKVTESNIITMKLIDKLTPTISIIASSLDICVGTPVTFTANVTNEGTTPVYQWKKNGQPVGTNSNTYVDNNLADGDVVSATLTSNASCLVSPTALSNNLVIKVMAKRTPTLTLKASGTSICVGTPVTFTATPTYEGSAPKYQWKKNGIAVGINATTYTDNNLINGDEISATLTSNESCITTTTAVGNPIKITVVSNLVPSISIGASSTNICPGSAVTFTATANGGSAPVYQWKKNGIATGTNAVTYVDSDLKDGDVISCLLIANDPCVVNRETTSNSITIKLVEKVIPAIFITASVTAICPGTPVTFKAVVTNGGTAPAYQWKKNGITTGTNAATYTDNSLADGDEVMCILTSNDICVVAATSESNRITIKVDATVLRPIDLGKDTIVCSTGGLLLNARAGYTNYKWQDGSTDSTLRATKTGTYFVEALDGCINKYKDTIKITFDEPAPFDLGTDKSICLGDSYTITAPPGFISYSWMPQQNNSGVNQQTTALSPQTSTTYTVFAKKSSGCTVVDSIRINVNIPPSINLGSDTTLCLGDSLFLNAGNGFLNYNWSNGSSKPSIIVKSKGQYIIKAKDSNGCFSGDTINILDVFNLPVVRLNKDSILCADSIKILDAGNTFKKYNWSTGQQTQNIVVNSVGIYKVEVTDSNGCKGGDASKITKIIPTPKNFLPADSAICSFDSIVLRSYTPYKSYSWSNGETNRAIVVKIPGNYLLQVKDEYGCMGIDSVLISPKECAKGFFIPNAFTPNGDGKNDVFKPIMNGIVQEYSFSVFNRWGEVVFTSSKVGDGWNGSMRGKSQDNNVFIWICNYRFQGGKKEFQKGTVVLIK